MPDGPRGSTGRRGDHGAHVDPLDVLAEVRIAASDAADLLLGLHPVLGEPSTQRVVDAFVEYAADALRALADRTLTAAQPDPSAARRPVGEPAVESWGGSTGAPLGGSWSGSW